jgi:hypothetical protein
MEALSANLDWYMCLLLTLGSGCIGLGQVQDPLP